MKRNNDDFTKDTTDQLIVKSKHKIQREAYKVVHNSLDDLKDKRKIRVHRKAINEIAQINNELNHYDNEKFKINSPTPDHSFKNDKFLKLQNKANDLELQTQTLLNERQKHLNRNSMLNSSLNYLNQKTSPSKNNTDYINKGNINFQDIKNEEYTASATKNIAFKTDKSKDLLSNSKDKTGEKIFQSERQKNINQKRMRKSFLDNPLTSKSVGERNLVQKTIMTPTRFIESTGASLKRSLNKDIEESNMAGVQLANDIVSPLARKLKFETEGLIARKVGFDKKAHKLYKIEKKIMKADNKTLKIKQAQRKRIRKQAIINKKIATGSKLPLYMRMKETSKKVKNKALKSLKNILEGFKNAKTLLTMSSLILIVIIPIVFIYPIIAISGSGISFLVLEETDSETVFIEYEGEFDLLGGKLVSPVPNYNEVSSSYGWRLHPIWGDRRFHTGIDIPAPTGTPVVASGDGVVIHSGNKGGYGKTIMINHGSGVITLYAHNSALTVNIGDKVIAGQKIAEVGSTGDSTGPHSHFEVRVNGEYTDPLKWITE